MMKNFNTIDFTNLYVEFSKRMAQDPQRNILIIDDDPEVFNWFNSIQSPRGEYKFRFLENEVKILETLQTLEPDMVFMDICLTTFSGRKIGEIIRVAGHSRIPIVYMSAKKDWNLRYDIEDKFFLSKPLEKSIITDKINTILKIR